MRMLLVLIMAVLALFSHVSELGISCSRPARVVLINQGRRLQESESKAQQSMDSNQALASQTVNHTISNCGELCNNGTLNPMFVKGPVPPSGPSHRGNASPNDRQTCRIAETYIWISREKKSLDQYIASRKFQISSIHGLGWAPLKRFDC